MQAVKETHSNFKFWSTVDGSFAWCCWKVIHLELYNAKLDRVCFSIHAKGLFSSCIVEVILVFCLTIVLSCWSIGWSLFNTSILHFENRWLLHSEFLFIAHACWQHVDVRWVCHRFGSLSSENIGSPLAIGILSLSLILYQRELSHWRASKNRPLRRNWGSLSCLSWKLDTLSWLSWSSSIIAMKFIRVDMLRFVVPNLGIKTLCISQYWNWEQTKHLG